VSTALPLEDGDSAIASGGPLTAIGSRPRLTALLGALCIAFSGILYRTADVSPETGATFRALYGLPVLALVAWLERRRFGPLPARTRSLAIIAGNGGPGGPSATTTRRSQIASVLVRTRR